MTDNEKAATFIGWKPKKDKVCRGGEGAEHDWLPGKVACHRCGTEPPLDWDYGAHMIIFPAPDMTDPRNYMKALEAVNAKGYDVCLESHWQLMFCRDMGAEEHRIAYEIGLSLSDVCVKALAALYDAEHPAETTE